MLGPREFAEAAKQRERVWSRGEAGQQPCRALACLPSVPPESRESRLRGGGLAGTMRKWRRGQEGMKEKKKKRPPGMVCRDFSFCGKTCMSEWLLLGVGRETVHLFYAGEEVLCAPVPGGGWGEMLGASI